MAFPQQIINITPGLTVASGVDIVSGTLAFGSGATGVTLSRSGKIRMLVSVSGSSELTLRNAGDDLPTFSNSLLTDKILNVGEFPWGPNDNFNFRLTRGGVLKKFILQFFADE